MPSSDLSRFGVSGPAETFESMRETRANSTQTSHAAPLQPADSLNRAESRAGALGGNPRIFPAPPPRSAPLLGDLFGILRLRVSNRLRHGVQPMPQAWR